MGELRKKPCTAVILAAGQGRRMGTKIQKQYLLLAGKPVLYYSLDTFQKSELIDEICIVTGAGDEEYCRQEIVERYGFTKVNQIIAGGAERYLSVWNALQTLDGNGYVFIHDGARPFVDEAMITRVYEEVCAFHACVVGMPVKDTIKIADEDGFVKETPDRSRVWMVQTPQVFETEIVKQAYSKLMETEKTNVTDDAMVVEQMMQIPVKFVEGSYENIKITTPEDLKIGEIFTKDR